MNSQELAFESNDAELRVISIDHLDQARRWLSAQARFSFLPHEETARPPPRFDPRDAH